MHKYTLILIKLSLRMCGFNVLISTELHMQSFKKEDRPPIFDQSILKHRGPDKHVDITIKYDRGQEYEAVISFDRLSIIDIEGGDQPIKGFTEEFPTYLVCNGEIYNYQHLRKICEHHGIKSTGSDCEVISSLYKFYYSRSLSSFDAFEQVVKLLDGDFAMVLLHDNELFMARDPIGVRPIFYSITNRDMICGIGGRSNTNPGIISIASEMKGCIGNNAVQLEPGTIGYINLFEDIRLTKKRYITLNDGFIHDDTQFIKPMLISAVEKRLMSERPLAYFLSGGLDSSIIASIGQKLSTTPIKTFSIGMENSTDLKYAKQMAEYLRSDHTEVKLDVDECIKSLSTLIYHLESYDCTTIRASMPMFMLSKYVSTHTPYKVVISGEGSDELFGGYLFFHNAPSNQAFQNETERLVNELYKFDVLRGDRSTTAHGLEIRVPFLDKAFVQKVLTLNTFRKRPNTWISHGGLPTIHITENPTGIEKFILREAFKDMLPKEVYERQKEAFSDGVGYSWVSRLKQHAEDNVSDLDMNMAPFKYPNNTPLSKEEYLYRKIFETYYPNRHDVIPYTWRPRWTNITDPSATMLSIHQKK